MSFYDKWMNIYKGIQITEFILRKESMMKFNQSENNSEEDEFDEKLLLTK